MQALSLVVLAIWLLALGRTILNLLLMPRLAPRHPRRSPLLSVIIPARDEERAIERTVREMLAQDYPALEIVVVNDRSTDTTGAILERLARADERLVIVQGEEPPPGWLGKPHALHLGSCRARGELLLFVDADVVYQPGALSAAVAHMEERGVPMLALLPHIEMHGFWEHVIMPNLAAFLFMFFPGWVGNRTRFALLGVGGGPGNMVRGAEYRALGGHEALKDAVIDDVAVARLFRRGGHRTEAVRAEQYVSVRMYHGLREIVEGFTKNAFAVFGRSYFVAVGAILLIAVVHMMPFVLAAMGDLIALATVGIIILTRVILFRALHYRLDNAILGHPLMLLSWLWILIRSIWYTGIRRRVHWRGRTYDAGKTRFGAD